MPLNKQVKITQKELCYDGFFKMEHYRLKHTLFSGGWSKEMSREMLERGHAAALLPYDPISDSVVLVEQFRIGAVATTKSPWLFEVVAGIIEEGEDTEQVVRRESLEEAGLTVSAIEKIYDYLVSPGGTSERITLYCGKVDASIGSGIYGLEHEDEDIRSHVVSFNTAMEMLEQGSIDSATPIIALQWLAQNRERLRKLWGSQN